MEVSKNLGHDLKPLKVKFCYSSINLSEILCNNCEHEDVCEEANNEQYCDCYITLQSNMESSDE